ncbi:MAG TPA: hypothetical protein VFL57_21170 [Bryobacteraceae bacterium]|nr:hypothetical protein [Bryobacteraceae bacterium]
MSATKSRTPDAANRTGGPKTEAGRGKSAANSMRHGVLSNKMIVLQSESNEEYEHLKQSYYEELQPVGLMESELVDEMIWAKWRQRRAITCETAAIDQQMDAEAEDIEEIIIHIDDSTRTAHAIQTLANESNDLALLNRYETRFHRLYHRAFRQLLELQDRRLRLGERAPVAPALDVQPVESAKPRPAPHPRNAKLPNEPGAATAIAKTVPVRCENPSAAAPRPLPSLSHIHSGRSLALKTAPAGA